MYKIVHLPSGNYVIDTNTQLPLIYFSSIELMSQVFDNRQAVFFNYNHNYNHNNNNNN